MTVQLELQKEIEDLSFLMEMKKHRAFQVWFITEEFGKTLEDAKSAVVDGPDDQQIDAIVTQDNERTVYFLQFKYSDDFEKVEQNSNEMLSFNALGPVLNGDIQGLISYIKKQNNRDLENKFIPIPELINKKNYKIMQYFVTTRKINPSIYGNPIINAASYNLRLLGYPEIIQRAIEYFEGRTGLRNFSLRYKGEELMKKKLKDGESILATVPIFEIYELFKTGSEKSDEEALFSANVRGLLDKKGKKPVAQGIRDTLDNHPDEFWLLNNGISILCEKFSIENNLLKIERGSIVNGCQTSYSIKKFFEESRKLNSEAEVLVKIISVKRENEGGSLPARIVSATNRQNPVDERDLHANDRHQVLIQRQFERIKPKLSEKKYYYQRKREQFKTYVSESVRSYIIIDNEDLAKAYIAAGLRRSELSQKGTDFLFKEAGEISKGAYTFIFKEDSDINDYLASYFCWWAVDDSYFGGRKWRSFERARSFKGPATFFVTELFYDLLKNSNDFLCKNNFVSVMERDAKTHSRRTQEKINAVVEPIFDFCFHGWKRANKKDPSVDPSNFFKNGEHLKLAKSSWKLGVLSKYRSRANRRLEDLKKYLAYEVQRR